MGDLAGMSIPPELPLDAPAGASPAPVAETCDWCGSTSLWWRNCKLICRNCGAIVKSCADL